MYDVVKTPEFLELRCKNYLESGAFERAMYWCELALGECPESSLRYLAKFHHIKGRILQAICFSELSQLLGKSMYNSI